MQTQPPKKRLECMRCILHEGIKGVVVGPDGVCNFCTDPTLLPLGSITEEDRLKYERDLEATLANVRGQGKKLGTSGEYDAVVGLSGGKDSTHLLYTLIHKYGLKVLPIAVDMGFMTKVAKDNIAQTCHKLGVQCVWYDSVASLFVELYKWIFAHRRDLSPANKSVVDGMLTARICPTCSDLLEGFIIQEAAKRKIPLVLFGLSPDQTVRHSYEIKPAMMQKSWVPDFVQSHPSEFSKEFISAWWDPSHFSVIPRVLFPYHAWKYSEAENIAVVEALGLIPPRKADPLVTNCDVLWAFSVYDTRIYGCNAYIFTYARLVREGKAERARWKKIFEDLLPAIQEGVMQGLAVRKFFKRLGYSLNAVIQCADLERDIHD